VAILKDIVTLTLDNHRFRPSQKGYREFAGGAPIKETLAAAMVL
jgi:putative N6-adenine-specific DNA methylase